MSKFNKLVELAKKSIEEHCLADRCGSRLEYDYNIYYWGILCPSDVGSVIFYIGGGDWYNNLMLRAGYSATTAYRKVINMDCDKLENKLDDWYKQELYPKLIEKLKEQEPELYEEALRDNKIKLNELKQINN